MGRIAACILGMFGMSRGVWMCVYGGCRGGDLVVVKYCFWDGGFALEYRGGVRGERRDPRLDRERK